MNRLNIRPAFIYRFKDSLRGMCIFYGILVILTAVVTIGFIVVTKRYGDSANTVNFSAYGFAACIFLFVCGIACIREDLRIGIQHGCSRRTAFVSNLLALALMGLILAVAGELLNALAQAVASAYNGLSMADLYQMGYTDWQTVGGLTFPQHLMSILVNFISMLFYATAGVLISLVFYRLNKGWSITVAIGVPALVFIGFPIIGAFYKPRGLIRFMSSVAEWVSHSAWNLVLISFIGIVVLTVINWLLVRRAPIKAAKK